MTRVETFKPDSRGRITLGKLAQGVSSFHAVIDEKKGQITLEPFVEIPKAEEWLYKNKKALKSVLKGIKEAGEGKLSDLGDFKQYLDE